MRFGVVGEERRRRVGGRAGIDDVAAEGAAVLVGDAAGPTCGVAEDREFVCNDGVVSDVCEGGSGADDDGVRRDFDETEFFEVPEGDKFFGLEAASAKRDHQFSAPGDGGVAVRGVGEVCSTASSEPGAMRSYWVTLERIILRLQQERLAGRH